MNFLKNTLVAALVAASLAVPTAAFAEFNDMPGGEIGEALQAAVDNGLINGIDENTIAPDDPITRAQMATIITRAFGAVEEADISFPDVADNAWYKDSVKKAVAMAAFEGDERGYFNPENNITFQETYTVLSRVFYLLPRKVGKSDTILFNVSDNALNSFSDKNEVASWAEEYTKSVVQNGGWKGIDGKLKPLDKITRGEFALIMHKLVKTYVDEEGVYDNLPSGLTIVRTGGVEIKNLVSDKNLILSYGIDEKGCKITDANIKGATIILGGSNPQEVKDPQTGEIKTVAGVPGYITLSGYFFDLRTISPYIYVDASNTSLEYYWGGKDTNLFLPLDEM